MGGWVRVLKITPAPCPRLPVPQAAVAGAAGVHGVLGAGPGGGGGLMAAGGAGDGGAAAALLPAVAAAWRGATEAVEAFCHHGAQPAAPDYAALAMDGALRLAQ